MSFGLFGFWGGGGRGLPNRADLSANFKNTTDVDGQYIIDTNATGTRIAEPAISTYFDGATSITYDLTGYEHLNAECHEISIEFYNTVEINDASDTMQLLQIGDGSIYDGIGVSTASAGILKTLLDGAAKTVWADAAGIISAGRHTLAISYNGTAYNIYLDDVLKDTSTVASSALVLDRLIIGASASGTIYLNNTYLANLIIKDASGQVIFADPLAAGAGDYTVPSVGVPGLIAGHTPPNQWLESNEFGYDWNEVPHFEGENLIPNSEAVGGAVGVAPTGWTKTSVSNGITVDVVGAGDGYADFRFYGTATATTFPYVRPQETTEVICAQGDTFTGSIVLHIIAGSVDEINLSLQLKTRTAVGGFLDVESANYVGDGAVITKTRSVTDILAERFTLDVVADVSEGQSVDFTVRISEPQLTKTATKQDYLATTGYPLQGKIPQDPLNIGYTPTGTPLNLPGTARNNLNVFGTTVDFDGATYAELDEAVTLSGDFEISHISNYVAGATRSFYGGSVDSLRYFTGGATVTIRINSVDTNFTLTQPLVADTFYLFNLKRVSTTATLTVTNLTTGYVDEKSVTVGTSSFTVSTLGKWSTAYLSGILPQIQIYDETDTLIHDWILEDREGSTNEIIYDRVGGNHATLAGYTDSAWTVQKAGSEMFAKGCSEGETDGVELWDDDVAVTTGEGWSYLGNNLWQHDGTVAGEIRVSNILEESRNYIFNLDVISAGSSGSFGSIQFGGPPITENRFLITAVGEYSSVLPAENVVTSTYGVRILSASDGSIVRINSIQKVTTGLVPASLTSPSQDVFGNALTQPPGKLMPTSPIEFTAPDSLQLFLADTEGQVSGVELVTNGDFSDGATGWLTQLDPLFTVENGIATIGFDSTAYCRIYQSLTDVAPEGTRLKLIVDVVEVVGAVNVLLTTNSNGGSTAPITVKELEVGRNVLPLHTCGSITTVAIAVSAGADVTWRAVISNISVQKINDPINYFFEPDGDKITHSADELLEQYGEELAVNGDFSAWTDDIPDGWTVSPVTPTATEYVTQVDGKVRLVSTIANMVNISQNITETGKEYRLIFDITDHSIGSVIITSGATNVLILPVGSVGSHILEFTASGEALIFKRSGALDITFDNISVKEITGTGATQNNQNFFGQRALLMYDAPLESVRNAPKALKYVKPYEEE